MPRYPRLFVAGYPHHLIQRGHDRQPVFVTERDYRVYLKNLAEQKTLLDIRVFAYCLMTNHVHLVVQPEHEGADLSRMMRVLAARQTRYTNRLEDRSGTLWEGRFKASLIDSDNYLLACCRYVELNPVRAGIAAHAEDYRWSSYRFRAGLAPVNGCQDLDPVYFQLGNSPERRQARYREFVQAGTPEPELQMIRSAVHRNQLTGNDRFANAIAERTGRRIAARGPGRPRTRDQR